MTRRIGYFVSLGGSLQIHDLCLEKLRSVLVSDGDRQMADLVR